MGITQVWIGRLDDPTFSWEGGDWNGNIPRPVSPVFPPSFAYGPCCEFATLLDAIRSGRLVGKQTDWGGSVAAASKEDILAFIEELYPQHSRPGPDSRPSSLLELREFVARLEDDGQFALVAAELT